MVYNRLLGSHRAEYAPLLHKITLTGAFFPNDFSNGLYQFLFFVSFMALFRSNFDYFYVIHSLSLSLALVLA